MKFVKNYNYINIFIIVSLIAILCMIYLTILSTIDNFKNDKKDIIEPFYQTSASILILIIVMKFINYI